MSEKLTKITCAKHKATIGRSNFYIAGDNTMFSGIGVIPVCKSCLYKEVERYYEIQKDMKYTIYLMCRKIDVAFDSNMFEGATRDGTHSATKVFMNYITQYNSLGLKNGTMLPFDEGEHPSFGVFATPQNKIPDEDTSKEFANVAIKLTDRDLAVKQDVIKLLEYDPFEGYSEYDQKFLYNDLYGYFGDEEVTEDQYLVSQILQIVNNNNQIRKFDYLVSQYTADTDLLIKNESKVKSISSMKKDIVANNDKISVSNAIAVGKRKGGNIKKSSLTVMMEYLRTLDFEDAEVDFYDQKKAYGMQMAADISMKAIAEQIQFDENDINEIIIEQRTMIKNMESKIADLEEKNRVLMTEAKNKTKKT